MTGVSAKLLMMVILCIFATLSLAEVAIPPLKTRVTDLTHTLSKSEIAQLEQKLADYEIKKGVQVAILIVPTTQPETIEQYSMRVVEAWKLGRKGVDDAVLLLVAKNDRALRIEVGYGLEGVLPDAVAKRIIDEIIVPAFREEDFASGLRAGIEHILKIIEGEPLPSPAIRRDTDVSSGPSIILDNIIPILLLFLVLGRILQVMFGRLIGATVAGTIAGSIVWLIFSSLAIAIFIAIVIFIISLFESTNRGVYRSGRSSWPGGGSFGGGGFRGGGGSFGGGGASGRW
ncbi:YgcG family protein [Nitrosomonas sp. Is37]|uniref:TPM domain-containing protein n=1 Tax=Nitrosomonas sp. Is37 TaxID=3080535 RepID=UPI00294AF2A6|nr:YgcG family protein [Nitrosomonas sp. Is37]MDV6344354.1 YgcG family protein [Nitrosomonas sp. Is37]